MKAAIYNPYLDTLGGGERYTLSFAKILVNAGYSVDLEWRDSEILKNLSTRFGISLNGIEVVSDVKRGDGYDLIFWVSDGSIPALKSRKNILHFQVPFHNVGGTSLINKMKLFRVNKVVCNSYFTKTFIDKEYGVDSVVIYPPVDTDSIKAKRKENIILFVGRFSELLQNKNQDLLVENFKKMADNGLDDWKLVIAGGVEIGADNYLNKIMAASQNYPIEIIQSPSFSDLKDLYGKAKVFWSASGFGEDETKNPEKTEHFGITVVEAMSAGVVPVVCNIGGYKEIIIDKKDGFLWNNTSELVKITKDLINNKHLLRQTSTLAVSASEKFSYKEFESNVKQIL